MASFILNKDRYKEAVLYVLQSLGRLEGRKKAYKLFYFLDFDFYEKYNRPFTGDTYTALKMGPAPRYLDAVIDELVKEKKVTIEKRNPGADHLNDMYVYTPVHKEDGQDFSFSPEERAMLDRIVSKYGKCTGKQLEDLSHAEAPYAAVGLNEVIPYEFSYYRDTTDL